MAADRPGVQQAARHLRPAGLSPVSNGPAARQRAAGIAVTDVGADGIRLPSGAGAPAIGPLCRLPDGTYRVGIRAHDLLLAPIERETIDAGEFQAMFAGIGAAA